MRLAACIVVVAALALGEASAAAAPSAVPGTALSITPQPGGWRGMSGGEVVRYWTTGSDGTPRPASGAVFVPPGPAPAGGWPILVFEHGTRGLGPGCGGQAAPERAPFGKALEGEDRILRHFVSKGFAVVAPDYLGLGVFDTGPHPYLELTTEVSATLDLLRVARAAHPRLSRTWMVLGGSQGGQAALGIAHRQRNLMPELNFRGAVAIDPESDVEHLLPAAGPWGPDLPGEIGDALTAAVASILAGLRAARPDARVDDYLTPRGRRLLDGIGRLCLDAIVARVHGIGIGDVLSKPLGDKYFRAVLADYMGVPTSGFDAPILLLINATDLAVPSPLHAALVAQLAANHVRYRMVVGTGAHVQLNAAMWSALDCFLDEVRASVPS
ncbi:alpha/beta hydrolase family protein [Nocardia terpenica]|uniref:Lipase n=1 Tax=Nocardia terpenica TaxID=455432 RepID=A0A291RTF8_9NOCA|nr:lipase family protein [Nocardia terpenica]ATL70580.1 lipase [Nocardia terpenica]